MTFRAKPVVKRAQKPSWESRDRQELLPQPRLRPRRRRPPSLILAIAVGAHLLQRPPRVGRQRRRPGDLQGRAARPRAHRGLAPRRRPTGGSRTQKDAGRLTAGPGRAAEPVRRAAAPAARRDRARAHHRHPDPGRPRGHGGHHGRRRRHRRAAPRGGDDPRDRATPGSSRSRPEIDDGATEPTAAQIAAARRRSTRRCATSRAARPGTTSPRPSRPTPRPRRRPATSAGSGQGRPDGRGVRRGALRAPRSNTPTAVVEGEDGIFRIGRVTEIAPEAVDERLHRQARQRRHRPRQVPRASCAATSSARSSRTRSSPTRPRPGPQREVSRDLPVRGDRRPAGRRGQGPPHPVLAQGRPGGAQSGDDPGGRSRPGPRPRPTRTRPTPSSRPTPPSSTRSPARRATRRAPAAPPARAACCGAYVSADSSYVESFSEPILAAKPTDGQLLRADQDRVRLAHRPGHQPRAGPGQDSRPRSTAAPTSRSSPATSRRAAEAEPRRRPRLGRQGPARRGADGRDLRDARSARRRTSSRSRTTAQYLFKVVAEEERDAGGPPARGDPLDAPSPTGTSPRRTPSTIDARPDVLNAAA